MGLVSHHPLPKRLRWVLWQSFEVSSKFLQTTFGGCRTRPRRPMNKYLDVEPASISTLEELLDAIQLRKVGGLLEEHGVTSLEAFLRLSPSALEDMGIPMGMRQRLLRSAEMIRIARPVASSEPTAAEPATPPAPSASVQPPRQPHNSTSSLYIDSTINQPDLVQLTFCVSLLVQDLIVDGESSHRAKLAAGLTPDSPFANLRPREIFVTGARARASRPLGLAPTSAAHLVARATVSVHGRLLIHLPCCCATPPPRCHALSTDSLGGKDLVAQTVPAPTRPRLNACRRRKTRARGRLVLELVLELAERCIASCLSAEGCSAQALRASCSASAAAVEPRVELASAER